MSPRPEGELRTLDAKAGETVIPIFMYHQVGPIPEQHDPLGLATPPQQFERQMAYLYQKGYQCLSLGEAVYRLRTGQNQPEKSFVITFDDGYEDLYSTVWPILDKFGFTATIFLVAERVGGESDWEGQNGVSAGPLLSWGQIQELAARGFTFGSHTLTHPRLTSLEEKEAIRQLRHSKLILEDHLEVAVELFSYPYSDRSPHIQELVARSGYRAACGGDRGEWGLFNLWRAQCGRSENLLSFALKAKGWHEHFIRLHEALPRDSYLFRAGRFFKKLLTSAGSSQVNQSAAIKIDRT